MICSNSPITPFLLKAFDSLSNKIKTIRGNGEVGEMGK
jgi:hypothetical protein